MIARLVICPSKEVRVKMIEEDLKKNDLTQNHPDTLYFPTGEKLGIAEAGKIRKHFSLKPYSAGGRMAVLEDAAEITIEAQNALLKTIEELPKEAILLLGASSDANLLPTILSRCEIINLKNTNNNILETTDKYIKDMEELLNSSIEERFVYVEKLKDREEFLKALVGCFHRHLPDYPKFTAQLLQAERWAKQNVNIRAILEYLMLEMPPKKC